jgi:hypothetical protein
VQRQKADSDADSGERGREEDEEEGLKNEFDSGETKTEWLLISTKSCM